MFDELTHFESYLEGLSNSKLKELVKKSGLKYSLLKNKQGIIKVKIESFGKERDLLDSDTMTAMISSYVGKTALFFDDKQLYTTLAQYAYRQGLISYKKPDPPKIDENWTDFKD